MAAVFLTAFLTAPFVLGCPKSVWAAQKASAWENEEETGPEEDDGLPGLLEIEEELAQLDQFLGQTEAGDQSLSFWELVKAAASGNVDQLLLLIGQSVEGLLLGEAKEGGESAGPGGVDRYAGSHFYPHFFGLQGKAGV